MWCPLRRACLRELEKDRQSRPYHSVWTVHDAEPNILKKVRISQGWRLCPVVRETNGRLRDRVRVGGRVEVHAEGVYYLEWREGGAVCAQQSRILPR